MPALATRHSKAHKEGKKAYRKPHYHIISPEKGLVGHSRSRKKAKASARIRSQRAGRKKKS